MLAAGASADQVYLHLFKAAVVTGARVSELCGLDWDDVDLLAGTVRISKQFVPTCLKWFAIMKAPSSTTELRPAGRQVSRNRITS